MLRLAQEAAAAATKQGQSHKPEAAKSLASKAKAVSNTALQELARHLFLRVSASSTHLPTLSHALVASAGLLPDDDHSSKLLSEAARASLAAASSSDLLTLLGSLVAAQSIRRNSTVTHHAHSSLEDPTHSSRDLNPAGIYSLLLEDSFSRLEPYLPHLSLSTLTSLAALCVALGYVPRMAWVTSFRQAASGSLFLLSAAQCGFMLEAALLHADQGSDGGSASVRSSQSESSSDVKEQERQSAWISTLTVELSSKMAIMGDSISLLYVSEGYWLTVLSDRISVRHVCGCDRCFFVWLYGSERECESCTSMWMHGLGYIIDSAVDTVVCGGHALNEG